MFRKNNKQVELESSESDMSSDNEEETPQPKQKFTKEPQHNSQSQSQEEEQMSDDEAEEEVKQPAPKAKVSAHHSNQQEEEDEEEEEDSEEDSLDDGDTYFRSREVRNGIHTIREDPKENLQDDSIDHIEQRIKKLEKDLQTRLNKHKQKPEQKNHGKIVSKGSALPPMPQKKSSHQENENKMHICNEAVARNEAIAQKKLEMKKIIQYQAPGPIAQQKQKEKKVKKEENPEIRQQKIESKHSQVSKKPKAKKQETKQEQKHHQFFTDASVTQQLQQKINQMSKAMKQLRLQNQILKQKIQSEAVKKEKNKNKTLESLEKIREASDLAGNSKLEKEIELLEVIEKLQIKLKKSISRKLAKQGNVPSSLLHKGLPTTMQQNF